MRRNHSCRVSHAKLDFKYMGQIQRVGRRSTYLCAGRVWGGAILCGAPVGKITVQTDYLFAFPFGGNPQAL